MAGNDRAILRALVVEDSEDDTLLLVNHLKAGGYEVDWRRVEISADLHEAIRDGGWDIVFSDYSMPHFRGDDALSLVRQYDLDVPFVFVSGNIGEETAVAAMKAGAQDYVMKSNIRRLVPVVQRELAEAQGRRRQRQAEENLRKLSLVVESAADSVIITDSAGRIEYVNPAFERMTGFVGHEVQGSAPAVLKSGRHEPEYFMHLWHILKQGRIFRDTMINRRKNGEEFYEEKTITPLFDQDGNISHYVSIGRDVTEKMREHAERERMNAIIEVTPDFVAIADRNARLLYMNRAGCEMLGVPEDTAHWSGLELRDFCADNASIERLDQMLDAARARGLWEGDAVLSSLQGRSIPVSQVILSHRNKSGDVDFYSIIARDITERKRFESQLEYQATHDMLTGLPNRVLFMHRLQMEVERARRHALLSGVVFFDLDNFKRVNDSLGHQAGDVLLQWVAKRLGSCLRPNDTVARLGGDEFAIVLSDVSSLDDILTVIRKVRAAFDEPLRVDGHELFADFSAGIAVYPGDGEDQDTLIQNADTAMYRAKAMGKGEYQFYAADMNARGKELLSLEADLRYALQRQEFVLHYQPQVDLATGCTVAVEALLRWQHPDKGLIPPSDFIPMLEETGLIKAAGEWVLDQACADCARYIELTGLPLRVAVNVSPRQFNDPGFLESVRLALGRHGIQAGCLELEITEEMVMQVGGTASDILSVLDSLGVRLAVDDFGTGYSSMAYLKRFPLAVLKIDRTFVAGLPADEGNAAIVEATIYLARKLDLVVVAEGVETAVQQDFLSAHGCQLMQGFHHCRPLAFDRLMDFLPGTVRRKP